MSVWETSKHVNYSVWSTWQNVGMGELEGRGGERTCFQLFVKRCFAIKDRRFLRSTWKLSKIRFLSKRVSGPPPFFANFLRASSDHEQRRRFSAKSKARPMASDGQCSRLLGIACFFRTANAWQFLYFWLCF